MQQMLSVSQSRICAIWASFYNPSWKENKQYQTWICVIVSRLLFVHLCKISSCSVSFSHLRYEPHALNMKLSSNFHCYSLRHCSIILIFSSFRSRPLRYESAFWSQAKTQHLILCTSVYCAPGGSVKFSVGIFCTCWGTCGRLFCKRSQHVLLWYSPLTQDTPPDASLWGKKSRRY